MPGGSNCGVDRTDAQSLLPGANGRFWRKATVHTQTASNDERDPVVMSPLARCSGSNLGDAHLLEQCQIIFDMPVVGDAAVLDLDEVGGDEGNGLTLTPRLAERAGEVSAKRMCTVT